MKKAKKKNLYPAAGAKGAEDMFAAESPKEKKDVSVPGATGRIGTDESGKGDYFGPLVTAAVWVDDAVEKTLLDLGVRDSKKISDGRAKTLAGQIKGIAPYALVTVGPVKYNELYLKMRNLNKLLAWTHARAIEDLLKEVACDAVIADKFGDEKLIENALMKNGRKIKLIQRVRAEADTAVAAASIVARAEFLHRLDRLSEQGGVDLKKGAGSLVDDAGLIVVRAGGEARLKTVAKWHFKNTTKILNRFAALK